HSSMAQKGGLCDADPLAWARAQSHLETAGQDPPHREKAGVDGAGRQGREKRLIQGARLKPLAEKSPRRRDRGSQRKEKREEHGLFPEFFSVRGVLQPAISAAAPRDQRSH